jgi:diaminopropionate ammonia-lyase
MVRHPGTILVNPMKRADYRAPPSVSPRWFHRRLPGYAVTPLRELPQLASSLGVGRIFVKDESMRLGLPAFKMLGASWATYRVLADKLGCGPQDWASIDDLKSLVRPLHPVTLAAATDGNHGRAVARMARVLGFASRIWLPSNTVEARIAAIAEEGATVHVSQGGYDDAVAESAAAADAQTLVISDTSWLGYETVPAWVIEGYATILEEIDEQLDAADIDKPDMVVVPIGVGAFAAAVAGHYRQTGARPMLVGAEPTSAACAMESARAGKLVQLEGPQHSIMAGLNCGTPSPIAWPTVSASFDLFVTVSDDEDIDAMRTFHRNGIVSGESGSAPLAALTVMSRDFAIRETLRTSTIVLLSTEGITDPAFYAKEILRNSGN